MAEMKQPMAGDLPPRQGGNPFASHANAIRMPIFELLQIITTSVSSRGLGSAGGWGVKGVGECRGLGSEGGWGVQGVGE